MANGILSPVTDLLFGSPDTGEAERLQRLAIEKGSEAAELFADMSPLEREDLIADIVNYYGQVPPEMAEQLGPSAMEYIKVSPTYIAAQEEGLTELGRRAAEGVTQEDIAGQRMLDRQVAAREQAQQKALAQEYAQRGMSGSGLETAARLAGTQAAAERGLDRSLQLGQEARSRAAQALAQRTGLAGQMRGQQFGEEAQKASARDLVAQFNLQQRAGARQREIARAQQLAGMKTGTRQQAYQSAMDIAKGQAAALTGQAQTASGLAGAAGQAAASEYGAKLGLLGDVAGAGALAYKASDERCKENIESSNVKEMLNNLEGYEYDYKEPEIDGEGRQVGVMAQDLEQSELGDSLVLEDETGKKMVNYGEAAPIMMAGLAELNKENEEMKGDLEKLKRIISVLGGK
jgi:hypothetical protein